ncbi:MAG: aminopeptidase N [Xanthomonadales bacterium]|nr:aminopeptidase N [Xanthomonadales bacterium]
MKKGVTTSATLRKDYTEFPWNIEGLELDFDIGRTRTRVRAKIRLQSKQEGEVAGDLVLDGKDLDTRSISVNGVTVDADRYTIEGEKLTIRDVPAHCELSTEVIINPADNTALEGLYEAGEFLLTQCEAEGFRKITWFPDRPDVMTTYMVRIEADREAYPVLLSNGNLVEETELPDGRHRVRWEDPFPKPAYLFALVAGDLAHVEDHFTTRSGRRVTLRVYVEHQNIDRCEHAMESLINAMRWDEDRFGLEYDLDIYNIVATNDFNMGAMENKSLNIFNSKYVLARPDTATDADYQGIEGVIGHEYFHNWTGNRVTCRDWFQLTLKEGLTVFRDEEFSADMQSHALKRIQDVRDLRLRQFPEDAGPMAHPIRPDRYVEINNFYTATVYQKGAAVIRMYHTLLGEEGFQEGMRLYFERHDGQAVACDDFLAAMADANGRDLSRFARWYSQSGTPEVRVETDHDADTGRWTLRLSQHTPATPDQAEKQPLVIPFAIGLLDREGNELPLQLEGEAQPGDTTRVLILEEATQEFTFENVPEGVVPSLLRDFSAPVKVRYPWTPDQLAHLMKFDSDTFMRWEAAQILAQDCILAQVGRRADGRDMSLDPRLVAAFEGLLEDRDADPALRAEAMVLPPEDYLAEQMTVVDVDGIHAAREFIRRGLAEALAAPLRETYERLADSGEYSKSPAAMARRSLRNTCLSYLVYSRGGAELAERQLRDSDNMTDSLAALSGLVLAAAPGARAALEHFEQRWKGDALVMDKWFAIQAMKPGPETVGDVRRLMSHPSFSMRNPNKVRALLGTFSVVNQTAFHRADGEGYALVADQVIRLDAMNPQMAARLAASFNRWKRFEAERKALMKQALERIDAEAGLSPDVSEIVSNALKD